MDKKRLLSGMNCTPSNTDIIYICPYNSNYLELLYLHTEPHYI
nr:MAG TPA: hypothetical protein [Caudoviricetes sp.]